MYQEASFRSTKKINWTGLILEFGLLVALDCFFFSPWNTGEKHWMKTAFHIPWSVMLQTDNSNFPTIENFIFMC